MLAGDRAQVGGDALGEPSLSLTAGRFGELAVAGEPDVTTAFGGGLDEQGVVLASDGVGSRYGDIVQEDEGPSVSPPRAEAYFGLAHVQCPCPGQWQRGRGMIPVPDAAGTMTLAEAILIGP